MVPPESHAALLHGYDWGAGEQQIYLSAGVALSPLSDTPVQLLYFDLCHRLKIDEGEPFSYDAFIRIDTVLESRAMSPFGDPFAVVDRLCTLLCAATRCAPWMVRIISSSDRFRSCSHTELLVGAPLSSEFIGPMGRFGQIDHGAVARIDRMWATCQELWRSGPRRSRITNALTYFYYAWRSYYMDQVCLNLAIALEVLFSPHHSGEVTHQISLAVAKFTSSDRSGREQTFDLMRRFYGFRSAVVHGRPNVDGLEDPTVDVFRLTADLLTEIVGDSGKVALFEDEGKRKALLRELLFS